MGPRAPASESNAIMLMVATQNVSVASRVLLSSFVKYLSSQDALAVILKLEISCAAIKESDERPLPFNRQENNCDCSFNRACNLPRS